MLKLALCLTLFSNPALAREQTCLLGKEDINWDNGSTTKGRSGVVICKNAEGKIVQTSTLKDGEKVGAQMRTFGEGAREEWSQDKNGRRTGTSKRFNEKGVAIEIRNQVEGNYDGLQLDFFESGKPKRVFFQEAKASSAASDIEYNEDGSVSALKCKPDQSLTKDDKTLCGFGGSQKTELMTGTGRKKSEVTYRNGNLEKQISYGRKGEVASEVVVTNGVATEKEFFEDGKVKILSTYKGRTPLTEVEYFMNGEKKREAKFSGEGRSLKKHELSFWDNGKLKIEGDYARGAYSGWSPYGTLTSYTDKGVKYNVEKFDDRGRSEVVTSYYSDSGKLADETTYKDGKLFRAKVYDLNGVFKYEKEFFPDGSSKLISGQE